ncbi:unnamed protein product [Caenorhabditis nigoni]
MMPFDSFSEPSSPEASSPESASPEPTFPSQPNLVYGTACAVCGSKKIAFNYGVICCNSCKMFFSRAMKTPIAISCKRQWNCNFSGVEKCRYCRLHRCLLTGMRCFKSVDGPETARIIVNLMIKDQERKNNLLNSKIPSNLTATEMFERKPIVFEPKAPGTEFDFYDWGVMNHLSCIDFATKFRFMMYLSPDDVKVLFKYSHLMYMILVTAMRSYSAGLEVMRHPDGSDVFPEEVNGYNNEFLNGIKGNLIGRMRELRVTEEELLLLGAIILCNPAVTDMSQSGRILLAAHRDSYGQALLQNCNVHSYGPSRFPEILSLTSIIIKTQQDIHHFSSLYPIVHPQQVKKNLFTDILDFLRSEN